jgi:uroporphyrinogen decarboxylase
MNERERMIETLLFGKPDRIPLEPGYGRKSTVDQWRTQGLPETVKNQDIYEYAYRQDGGKLGWPQSGKGFHVDERMIPQFEEKVIERKKDSQIVQDWKGNICEIGNEFTVEYLRNAIDFVTRRWIKCPVESMSDWEEMKKRYDSELAERLPMNRVELAGELKTGKHFIQLHFSGPFWQLREWLGFENLCTMLYDNPDSVREMISFWCEHVDRLMKRAFQYIVPDCVYISEDMAYKRFSMISPAMAREFLLPVWKKWGETLKNAGVQIYAIDSDGFIGELIPLWIEAGMNVCDPLEVAAGNDIVEFRRLYGRKMAFRGGVDKRCIAKGGAAIKNEIERILPVIRDGGYIPSCDHGVPSDVTWPNFVNYTKLLAEATGWI